VPAVAEFQLKERILTLLLLEDSQLDATRSALFHRGLPLCNKLGVQKSSLGDSASVKDVSPSALKPSETNYPVGCS